MGSYFDGMCQCNALAIYPLHRNFLLVGASMVCLDLVYFCSTISAAAFVVCLCCCSSCCLLRQVTFSSTSSEAAIFRLAAQPRMAASETVDENAVCLSKQHLEHQHGRAIKAAPQTLELFDAKLAVQAEQQAALQSVCRIQQNIARLV